jgi:hypothetical protein
VTNRQHPDGNTKYRKIDGTLLTEPPRTVAPAVDPFVDAAKDDSNDCDNFDSMPLEAVPGEEFSCDIEATLNPDAAFGIVALQDGDDSDDKDTVHVGAI